MPSYSPNVAGTIFVTAMSPANGLYGTADDGSKIILVRFIAEERTALSGY
jgi:hypothetical protein